jgi:hypothetical protein
MQPEEPAITFSWIHGWKNDPSAALDGLIIRDRKRHIPVGEVSFVFQTLRQPVPLP